MLLKKLFAMALGLLGLGLVAMPTAAHAQLCTISLEATGTSVDLLVRYDSLQRNLIRVDGGTAISKFGADVFTMGTGRDMGTLFTINAAGSTAALGGTLQVKGPRASGKPVALSGFVVLASFRGGYSALNMTGTITCS